MERKEEGWMRYVLVSIAIASLLTAFSAYLSSDLSTGGMNDMTMATRRLLHASNAYSASWTEASLSHFAGEMAEAWYEIANYTGNTVDMMQAQHWQRLADEKNEKGLAQYDLYLERMEQGFTPVFNKGVESLTKASQVTMPIIFFQISATLLVVTQVTRKKVVFVFSWGLIIIGLAYFLPILFDYIA